MKPKNAGRITTEQEAERSKLPKPEWSITYGIGRGWYIRRFIQSEDRFYFRWPHEVYLKDTGLKFMEEDGTMTDILPLSGIIAINVSYGFRQRMKQLKDGGWHNSGPDLYKKCFMFSMKGENGNKPFQIAIRFDGHLCVWAGRKAEDSTTDQLINMVTMLNS